MWYQRISVSFPLNTFRLCPHQIGLSFICAHDFPSTYSISPGHNKAQVSRLDLVCSLDFLDLDTEFTIGPSAAAAYESPGKPKRVALFHVAYTTGAVVFSVKVKLYRSLRYMDCLEMQIQVADTWLGPTWTVRCNRIVTNSVKFACSRFPSFQYVDSVSAIQHRTMKRHFCLLKEAIIWDESYCSAISIRRVELSAKMEDQSPWQRDFANQNSSANHNRESSPRGRPIQPVFSWKYELVYWRGVHRLRRSVSQPMNVKVLTRKVSLGLSNSAKNPTRSSESASGFWRRLVQLGNGLSFLEPPC